MAHLCRRELRSNSRLPSPSPWGGRFAVEAHLSNIPACHLSSRHRLPGSGSSSLPVACRWVVFGSSWSKVWGPQVNADPLLRWSTNPWVHCSRSPPSAISPLHTYRPTNIAPWGAFCQWRDGLDGQADTDLPRWCKTIQATFVLEHCWHDVGCILQTWVDRRVQGCPNERIRSTPSTLPCPSSTFHPRHRASLLSSWLGHSAKCP